MFKWLVSLVATPKIPALALYKASILISSCPGSDAIAGPIQETSVASSRRLSPRFCQRQSKPVQGSVKSAYDRFNILFESHGV